MRARTTSTEDCEFAVHLFVTEKLPVDLVALLVMALLLLSGIVTPTEGLSGFCNTATITVGASLF